MALKQKGIATMTEATSPAKKFNSFEQAPLPADLLDPMNATDAELIGYAQECLIRDYRCSLEIDNGTPFAFFRMPHRWSSPGHVDGSKIKRAMLAPKEWSREWWDELHVWIAECFKAGFGVALVADLPDEGLLDL